MSKKNYKKSRKYKKMRRRKIIFGIEITVLLILSGILFVYAWINRSMDKMNQDTLDSSQIQINSEVKANTDLSQMSGTQVIALVGVDARGVEGSELAESMISDTIITRYNPQNSPSTNTRQPFRSSSVKSVISFNSSSSKTCLFLAT